MISSDAVRHPLEPLHPATRAGLLELARELQPARAALGDEGGTPSFRIAAAEPGTHSRSTLEEAERRRRTLSATSRGHWVLLRDAALGCILSNYSGGVGGAVGPRIHLHCPSGSR